jgi:hypothetical protein
MNVCFLVFNGFAGVNSRKPVEAVLRPSIIVKLGVSILALAE